MKALLFRIAIRYSHFIPRRLNRWIAMRYYNHWLDTVWIPGCQSQKERTP